MDVTMGLPVSKISDITAAETSGWLIEDLWSEEAAGIIGGQPKCCKSWLGLDMAVSVASDTACLGKFRVLAAGPTLIFLAEDSLEQVRGRVEGICQSRGLDLKNLDLSIITSPALRLDSTEDQDRLRETINKLKPKLLLLDPLVRLHRLDENNARDISGLLGFLRTLQREHQCAIILTHHASKRACARPGQGLRGSSDLHAFGDSNIYLSRKNDDIELIVEHRAAVSSVSLMLRLQQLGDSAYLTISDDIKEESSEIGIEQKIISYLKSQSNSIQKSEIRQAMRINNQRLGVVLNDLQSKGALKRDDAGWTLN